MASNPYLEGNFGPVHGELTAFEFDLDVRGQLPPELCGRLLRIGPNPIAPDADNYHWFTGNGMVHGLRLHEGRALWYRRRYVRDDDIAALDGRGPVEGPRPVLGANIANTNVVDIGGQTYAIVEAGGLPVALTDELETIRRSDFDGGLKTSFSAHPHVCPDTGEAHLAAYSPMDEYLHHVVVSSDGVVVRDEPVHLPHKPMVHDCAITKNW